MTAPEPLKEAARRAGAAALAGLLRLRSGRHAPSGAPALVVAPHPDDETLGCGGLIAAAARDGRRVAVAFLTAGAGSHPGHPALGPERLATLRREEALGALAELGAPAGAARFLGARDGGLDRLEPGERRRLESELRTLIAETGAREVFVTWGGDGSTEHAAAAALAAAALAAAGGGDLLEYPVWAWWNPLRLLPRVLRAGGNERFPLGGLRAAKLRALARHRTQVEPSPPWTRPVLPPAVARPCSGPAELFFRRRVAPAAR